MKMIIDIVQSFSFRNDFWGLALPFFLIVIDVILGTIGACVNEEFSSARMRKGLSKKAGEVSILVIGELFCYALQLPPYIMTFFSLYIIIMELSSIVENLGKLGVPIPKFIKGAVSEVNETLNDEEFDVIIKRIDELEKKEKERNDK